MMNDSVRVAPRVSERTKSLISHRDCHRAGDVRSLIQHQNLHPLNSIVRGVILRGASWAELWPHALVLWAMAIGIIGYSAMIFRKRVA